jgi:prepilin-type processing-associated H-X9-DG protein
MPHDEQLAAADSGPKDAAKGLGLAIPALILHAGVVYLAVRLWLSPLWSSLVLAIIPCLLVAWAVRDTFFTPRPYSKPWIRWAAAVWRTSLAVCVGLILWYIGTGLVAVGQHEAVTAQKGECVGNTVVITRAITACAASHEGQFPDARTWVQDIQPHLNADIESLFSCPVAGEPGVGFAYNAGVSGVTLENEAELASVVILLESDASTGSSGGPELLPAEPRHFGGDNYGFADGHVVWLKRKKNPDGSWAKEPEADVIWEPVLKGDGGSP